MSKRGTTGTATGRPRRIPDCKRHEPEVMAPNVLYRRRKKKGWTDDEAMASIGRLPRTVCKNCLKVIR